MSNSSQAAPQTPEEAPSVVYQVGERGDRPWGHYIVTDTGKTADGEEFCEKSITIRPLQILSLQSHQLRRETWTVKRGVLTVLLDGQRIDLLSGEALHIPVGSIHCMANLGDEDCIVQERQEGICREADIKRFMDVYRRDTENLASPVATESFTAYRTILVDINKIRMSKKNGTPY
jgi:mannose-6-phosphate isomerase-like protein (cupin superfamily)